MAVTKRWPCGGTKPTLGAVPNIGPTVTRWRGVQLPPMQNPYLPPPKRAIEESQYIHGGIGPSRVQEGPPVGVLGT